jgi:hypothetical protein
MKETAKVVLIENSQSQKVIRVLEGKENVALVDEWISRVFSEMRENQTPYAWKASHVVNIFDGGNLAQPPDRSLQFNPSVEFALFIGMKIERDYKVRRELLEEISTLARKHGVEFNGSRSNW